MRCWTPAPGHTKVLEMQLKTVWGLGIGQGAAPITMELPDAGLANDNPFSEAVKLRMAAVTANVAGSSQVQRSIPMILRIGRHKLAGDRALRARSTCLSETTLASAGSPSNARQTVRPMPILLNEDMPCRQRTRLYCNAYLGGGFLSSLSSDFCHGDMACSDTWKMAVVRLPAVSLEVRGCDRARLHRRRGGSGSSPGRVGGRGRGGQRAA